MYTGASIFLIALGAILKFAVTDTFSHINLGIVGVILMIVGGIGLLWELIDMASRRRRVVASRYVADPTVVETTTRHL